MASLRTAVILFSLLFLSLSAAHDDIHDVLSKYGFPKGLIPNAVNSYSLSSDGSLVIELDRSCYVQFGVLVHYHKNIQGKISYGSVKDVSGIKARKQRFIWVSVTGIEVDSRTGMIEFYHGARSMKFPMQMFQHIPNCKNKSFQGSLIGKGFI